MRIISGKYKSRVIKTPDDIRPTEDRVRKALFDVLGGVEGLRFLELFAGSGAIGFEALSLGVKEVVFVEKNRHCVKVLQENLLSLKCQDAQVINKDALEVIPILARNQEKFDLVMLDPPYYKEGAKEIRGESLAPQILSGPRDAGSESLAKKTLQMLGAYDIVTPHGFIIVQHFKKDFLPEKEGKVVLLRQLHYGDTVLSLYQKA